MGKLFRYLLYSFLWSWIFWILAAAISFSSNFRIVLHAIGGLGPLLGAVSVLRKESGFKQREYIRSFIDFKRINARIYLMIIFIVPVMMITGIVIDILMGGAGYYPELIDRIIKSPGSIFYLIIFYLAFGPLPEESGWRGIALPELQKRNNFVASSLILGLIWALWHLPLFFIEGSYQNELGFGSFAFIMFNIMIILTSFFYTWLYNKTNGSILSAILFHFSVNFFGEMVELTERAEFIVLLLWFAVTIVISLTKSGKVSNEN